MLSRGSWVALSVSTLLSVLGCDSDTPSAVSDTGPATFATVSASWDKLARDHSCTLSSIDPSKLPERCVSAAMTWLECAGKDKAQCICESDDGNLNCEGSWKPNEGPAHCIAEHTAFADCAK